MRHDNDNEKPNAQVSRAIGIKQPRFHSNIVLKLTVHDCLDPRSIVSMTIARSLQQTSHRVSIPPFHNTFRSEISY